jgi:predicted glycosyltransferase
VAVRGLADNQEQVLRAEALERRGLARLLQPSELTPGRLLEAVNELLQSPDHPRAALNLGGLPAVVDELEMLLSSSAA